MKNTSKDSEVNRISKCILFPLTCSLRLTSVPVNKDIATATKLWAAFCLLICAQAHVYIFYQVLDLNPSWKENMTEPKFIFDYLMLAFSFKSMILDLATYILLVVKLGPFLDSLWERCKSIDHDLNYPNMRCVARLSFISVSYLSTTVIIKS